jgi:lipopolysaccharide/colanic/teichoic acid biosynthesis glycosyltransferase
MIYRFLKRSIDIIVSIIGLLLLSPLFIILIPLLRFTGEKEVFYRQERIGYNNQFFKIWKFATMINNSPNLGNGDVTLRNDPRITPIGRYLRITKINELPQLFNVLKGDMTIVGPRPLMEVGFNRYSQKYQNTIYNIKPGLTGIGAIALRDEEKIMTDSDLPPHECYEKRILPYKGALEMWYQEKKSLLIDFMIIFFTVWVILFPKSNLPFFFLKDLPKRPDYFNFK